MDVELIHWPSQQPRRTRLADLERPRLLLVAARAEPPESVDLLEDWVRLPASNSDVRARVRDLHRRVARHRSVPTIDSDGVLRFAMKTVTLSDLHARLTRVLVTRIEKVVSRRDLIDAGWGEETPSRNTVDVHMTRLRRRLATVGLSIRTVRNRGFILERSDGTA